jgi:hypothetical protein
MIVPANQKALQYIPKPVLQQPFELLLSVMCLLSGITYVLGNTPSSAIDRFLPEYFVKSWGLCLCIGSILLLTGILKTNPLLQRAGLSLLSPTSIVYAIVLIAYVGKASIFSASIITAFSLACAVKDYTIKIATMSIKQVFKDHG